jgi:predicted RNA-binding Zn-ribbon protein involved in translation (DUF1610 family)
MRYSCNGCGWEGDEKEAVVVPVCPGCRTGHIFRLMAREESKYECPNCSLVLTPPGEGDPLFQYKLEPECPMCKNQYLREV